MSKIEKSIPAFPTNEGDTYDGMTIRQYAAIKLKVPDSGTDWLDEMISKSLRDELAGKAMVVFMAETDGPNDDGPDAPRWQDEETAVLAYTLADAMLEARK